jgi:hypothetical protein
VTIINVAGVGYEAVSKGGDDIQFMDNKVEHSIGGCGRSAHCSAIFFNPKRVAKLEGIVKHKDGEAADDSGSGASNTKRQCS